MDTSLVVLDRLITNLAKTRQTTHKGKDYLVADVVLIVPGVLAGSDGPILYPAEEVARNAEAWNGQPLTLRHPSLNGVPVPARTEGVDHLGTVQNASFREGKLTGEGWFNISATRAASPELLRRLEQNEQIELSTGLFIDRQPAQPGSTFNGRRYTHVARNIRPDHLAILPDEVGACSLGDGCGVNANNTGRACTCHSCNTSTVALNCSCDKCQRELTSIFADATRSQATPNCFPVSNPVTHSKGEGVGMFEINRDPNTGMLLPLDAPVATSTTLIPTTNSVRAGLGVGLPVTRVVFGNPLAKLGAGFVANSDNKEAETRVVVG